MNDDLKYALFNVCPDNGLINSFWNFIQTEQHIEFIYKYVYVKGFGDRVVVSYDAETPGQARHNFLKYINKENTEKSFQTVHSAIDYMLYLSRMVEDVRYELYHYLIYKFQKLGFTYSYITFRIVGEKPEEAAIRCDISDLAQNGKELPYNISFVFNRDATCTLYFFTNPGIPFHVGKICPESDIDKCLEYLVNLNVVDYDDIPIKEVG